MICIADRSPSCMGSATIPSASRGAFAALSSVLRNLAEVVASLSDTAYSSAGEATGGGSIGAHVRHCLDHIALLIEGLNSGVVNYDRRQRGTAVETQRWAAFDLIRRLERLLAELKDIPLQRPLRVRGVVDESGEVLEVGSSVGREVMFVLSHTIHHNAMIGMAARRLGGCVPSDFGYAPATVAHMKSRCAPSPLSH